MKYLMICISIFSIANNLFAASVPAEITDDYMKVSTTTLVMQLLPETFYNIKLLNTHRDPSKNDLVGAVMGLKRSDGTCVVAASWTDSTLCSSVQNCQIQGTAVGLPSCDFTSSAPQLSLVRFQTTRQAKYRLENKCVAAVRGGYICNRNWVSR